MRRLFLFARFSVGASCFCRYHSVQPTHQRATFVGRKGGNVGYAQIPRVKYEAVTPEDIDFETQADLERYLKMTRQEAGFKVTLAVKNDWIAEIMFKVNDSVTFALGVAQSKKNAQALCYMHAAKLIDYLSTTSTSDTDLLPPPLRMFPPHAASEIPVAPPPDAHQVFWDQYISDCEIYIAVSTAMKTKEFIRQGENYPVGNRIVDTASNMINDELKKRSVLRRLACVVPPRMQKFFVRKVAGTRVATMPIPGWPFKAMGVANSPSQAKERCAAHALSIFRLIKTHLFEELSFLNDGNPSRVAPLPLHHYEAQVRLIDLYSIVRGDEKIPPVFERDTERHSYRCKLQIGELVCCGLGLQRDEAERSAITLAYEKLLSVDPRFSLVVKLLNEHPQLDPATIARMELPTELAQKIEQLVASSPVYHEEDVQARAHKDPGTEKLLAVFDTSWRPSDHLLRYRLQEMRNSEAYRAKFKARRESLAMYQHKDAVIDLVDKNRVVLICGTTGCGKTTQVPQYLLDNEIEQGRGSECTILITQPRRISATSIAQRIADERLEKLGQSVGYSIRLDSKPGGNINMCTTGVLLQILISKPDLKGVKYLILDEIHERDINCDFALALVHKVLKQNSQLKVILMSATMQAELFSQYFAGAPVLQVEGQVYPVREFYIDDITRSLGLQTTMTNFQPRGLKALPPKFDYDFLGALIDKVVASTNLTGKSILVFLPGWGEIMKAARLLDEARYYIIKLHSTVSAEEQQRVFRPAPPGKAKVILSTNIAESGVTIDDVAVVIDSGTIKESGYVMKSGGTQAGKDSVGSVSQLKLAYAAKANCTQRKGRAGRTQGGICFRLYTSDHFHSLPNFQTPEIHRSPLDSLILRILAMGYDNPRGVLSECIEPPKDESIELSLDALTALGAVDLQGQLTPIGRLLAKLPVEPRIGKMILLGSVLNCLDSVLTIAATTEMSPFLSSRELDKEVFDARVNFSNNCYSDHIAKLNAFNLFARDGVEDQTFSSRHFMSFNALTTISKYKQQYLSILSHAGFIEHSLNYRSFDRAFVDYSHMSSNSLNVSVVKGCLCAGLFPNIVQRNTTDDLNVASQNKNSKKENTFRNKMHSSIIVSRKSVLRYTPSNATFPYFMYETVMSIDTSTSAKLQGAFLSDLSSVSVWAVLLLGASSSHITFVEDIKLGIIDGWLVFTCSQEAMKLILDLKAILNVSISRRFSHPSDLENIKRLVRIQEVCKEILCLPVYPEMGVPIKEMGAILNPLRGQQYSPIPLSHTSPAEIPVEKQLQEEEEDDLGQDDKLWEDDE